MLPSSTLSPDQDIATITSSRVIMPRSPWLASLGVHEEGRRAGRGEGGGELLADVPALADAADDDAALGGGKNANGRALKGSFSSPGRARP